MKLSRKRPDFEKLSRRASAGTRTLYSPLIAYNVGLCLSLPFRLSLKKPFIQFFCEKMFSVPVGKTQDQNKDKKISWKIIYVICTYVLNFKLNVPWHRIGIEPLLKTLFQDGKFSVKSQRKQNQFSQERFMTVSNSFRWWCHILWPSTVYIRTVSS